MGERGIAVSKVVSLVAASLLVILGSGCDGAKGMTLDARSLGKYMGIMEDDSMESESFGENDKIVGTYYFYWYDNETGHHISRPDGSSVLTVEPASLEGYSYKNVDWHKQEIREMLGVGIDLVLPVYFGNAGRIGWSVPGLQNLVIACEELEKEGITPPKIGMFYDTTSLFEEAGHQKLDLTSTYGQQLFYGFIKDFYSMIPPKFRARIDGRPIVWLYVADYFSNYSQDTFDFANRMFKADFMECGIYIVKEATWTGVRSDDVYQWWASTAGPRCLGAMAVGPGYNESALIERQPPYIRDRDNGNYYRASWDQVLLRSVFDDLRALDVTRNLVVIETWNEFHEGTNVTESKQYGRDYLDITAGYVQKFKRDELPEGYADSRFQGISEVSISFGDSMDNGITHVKAEDCSDSVVDLDGVECLRPDKGSFMYMYFRIDDYFKLDKKTYEVDIEFYDGGNTIFNLEYDSSDKSAPLEGAYKGTDFVRSGRMDGWKRHTFLIEDAMFAGRQNNAADFRICANSDRVMIRCISVRGH